MSKHHNRFRLQWGNILRTQKAGLSSFVLQQPNNKIFWELLLSGKYFYLCRDVDESIIWLFVYFWSCTRKKVSCRSSKSASIKDTFAFCQIFNTINLETIVHRSNFSSKTFAMSNPSWYDNESTNFTFRLKPRQIDWKILFIQ